tara:strand:+ start:194 stop:469 length:276 start_codon:yes stop_codon:yes gene_type:complete
MAQVMTQAKFDSYKVIKQHIFCELDDTVTDQLILSTSKSNYTLEQAKDLVEVLNKRINTKKVFHYLQEDETSEPEKVFYERTYYTLKLVGE